MGEIYSNAICILSKVYIHEKYSIHIKIVLSTTAFFTLNLGI